jgi:DNA-3-methyladenine glycosylase II
MTMPRSRGEAEAGIATLDDGRLREAVAILGSRDPRLAAIVDRHGMPPLWPREPGFETLVRIVLEQQVTLDSGQAAFERLRRAAGAASPGAVAALDEPGVRAAGITRQKARYLVAMGRAAVAGDLDLEAIGGLSDHEARERLLAVVGVGQWTADVYLLIALRRPDIWPAGDIALATAARDVLGLPERPRPDELTTLAEPWRPWRAVAARLLWHAYLSSRAARRRSGGPPV